MKTYIEKALELAHRTENDCRPLESGAICHALWDAKEEHAALLAVAEALAKIQIWTNPQNYREIGEPEGTGRPSVRSTVESVQSEANKALASLAAVRGQQQ